MTPTVGAALAQSGLVPIDGQVLLAAVLGRDRGWLVAHRDDVITRAESDAYIALAKRRRDGEPIAYLTGKREFWGIQFTVTSDVLIPRPETETLVELALSWLPRDGAPRVLDLGTGSGAIALAIVHERPTAVVVATDASAAALDVARANAERLGLRNVEFVSSNWYVAVPSTLFTLIVCNPPYIARGDPHLTEGDLRFEPATALSSGSDGLDALRIVIAGAPQRLLPGGALIVEHGYNQSEAVQDLLSAAGFGEITVRRDLAGIARIAGGRRPL